MTYEERLEERRRIVEENNYVIKAGRVEYEQEVSTWKELQKWNREHPDMKIVEGENGYE